MIAAGVIGWPVAHSKSPLIHRFWLAKLGIDGDYSRFLVRSENLGFALRALPALGLRGVNVTVPHKVAVMAYLDTIDPGATRIGAVNTIVVATDGQTLGLNTDATGFLDPLLRLPRQYSSATVMGAGGAARAVLQTLRTMKIQQITLINRSEARAFDLLQDFPEIGTVVRLTDGYIVEPADLLINATSLGMIGQPSLHINLDRLSAQTLVYDLVYAPIETPLLAAARERGHATLNGLHMLVGQAAAAFALFYGVAPPREHDAALHELLAA